MICLEIVNTIQLFYYHITISMFGIIKRSQETLYVELILLLFNIQMNIVSSFSCSLKELRKRRKFIGLSQYFIRQLKIKATCYIWFCLCINKIFFGCVSVRSNSRRIICNNTSVLFRHINVFSHKKYKMRLNAKNLIVVATAFVTRIWMIWHFIGFSSIYSDWQYNKIAYNLLI